MPDRFRANDPRLEAAYANKKRLEVLREPLPSSKVCSSCWAQATCMRQVQLRDPPLTCCVYTHFDTRAATTVEDLIAWTCETSCVARQSWAYDHVPHTPEYCANHCPVSRFLLDAGPSDYE